MKDNTVKKAVIAAAGFGTRFLPQTKAMPKEMLPIVDKPIIQYVVEDLVAAGIEDIIIVTNQLKRSIEDHFDTPGAELAAALEASGKQVQLDALHNIANMANFVYVRSKPVGNAAPLLSAGHLLDGAPFIYIWGDEFVLADPGHASQMISMHQKTGASVLPSIKLTKDEEYDRYGVMAGDPADGLIKLKKIVEKPGKNNAPSDLANVGGYLFNADIIQYVERAATTHDWSEEFKIQIAIQNMIDDGHPYFAYEIQNGTYYDAGNKLEYLKTVIDFALRNEEIKDEFRAHLKKVVADQ
jgi:UTP--glucose-1-phosphate uridylyltransferase